MLFFYFHSDLYFSSHKIVSNPIKLLVGCRKKNRQLIFSKLQSRRGRVPSWQSQFTPLPVRVEGFKRKSLRFPKAFKIIPSIHVLIRSCAARPPTANRREQRSLLHRYRPMDVISKAFAYAMPVVYHGATCVAP